jgi:tripartite-type tricarboxylate transporter receptor subunit TctC
MLRASGAASTLQSGGGIICDDISEFESHMPSHAINASFKPNEMSDSGIRAETAVPTNTSEQPSATDKSAALPATQPASTVTQQGGALAQSYPTKPVTMVVPYGTGGAPNAIGRILAQGLSEVLGQQVVVENVGGAYGTTGSKRVADAAPDGYTFVLGGVSTHAQHETVYKRPVYTAADFTPVALIAKTPQVLIARKDLPVDNLQEFIAYAKANQSKMRYGWAGSFGCMLLNSLFGVDIMPERFRDTTSELQALQFGRIDYQCSNVALVKPRIDNGSVKAIAIMSKERSSALPNVPTAFEQGTPNLEVYEWVAFFLPKGTPANVVKKLNDATVQAMKTPALKERLGELGFVVVPEDRATPEYLAQFVKSEIEKWAVPIKASGITRD